MNENLNLVEILKDYPEGTRLYSTIHGDVLFQNTYGCMSNPIIVAAVDGMRYSYTSDGKYIGYYKNSECVLFPSKDQRDWSKFKLSVKRFDPKKFKPFDKVLWKGLGEWRASFFSHYLSNDVHEYEIYCTDGCFGCVIPYNDETKHLLGTTNDCLDYYKWWLDVQQNGKQRPSLAVND